jgi:hypothetical protein
LDALLGTTFGEMDEDGGIVDVKSAEMVAAWNRFGCQKCQSVEREGIIGFENHWLFGGGSKGFEIYYGNIFICLSRLSCPPFLPARISPANMDINSTAPLPPKKASEYFIPPSGGGGRGGT